MGMRMLRAACRAGKKGNDQYFCVSDDAEKKDWLSGVPAVDDSTLLGDAGVTELCIANMRRVMESDARLHAMTGYTRREFGMIYRAFAARWEAVEAAELDRRKRYREERAGRRGPGPAADVYEDYVRNVPLVRDDPIRASGRGNRCRLHPAYVLLLDLVRKYRNNCQDQLGVIFGIDQSAVCGHIRVADRILAAMLPTPHRFMDVLRHVHSPGEFAALFPEGAGADTILADGTHARFVRAKDRAVRDAMYSGKKKAYTGNTVILAMPDGMVIAISRTLQGSVHDITITRGLLDDLGAFAEDVPRADLPEGTRKTVIRVPAGPGFLGLDGDLPGAEVAAPVRKPRGGGPTKREKARNRRLSRERVRVENAIASVKHYRRVSPAYGGTPGDFNAEFNIACGPANAGPMLRNGTHGHWQSVLDGGGKSRPCARAFSAAAVTTTSRVFQTIPDPQLIPGPRRPRPRAVNTKKLGELPPYMFIRRACANFFFQYA